MFKLSQKISKTLCKLRRSKKHGRKDFEKSGDSYEGPLKFGGRFDDFTDETNKTDFLVFEEENSGLNRIYGE